MPSFRLSHPVRAAHWLPACVLLLAGLLLAEPVLAQADGEARLKDLVNIDGAAPMQLTGYGLVVGLDRSGDRARGSRGAPYTVQGIANMLRRFGITVDPDLLSSRNVAAVMVTAMLDPFGGTGGALDVTVSSMGDAQSLNGGVLLQTPLLNPMTQQVYAMAQGPISTGAILAEAGGASARSGQTNTGRVPGGALITQGLNTQLNDATLALNMRRPDFTNARRVADAINEVYPGSARAAHAGRIDVEVPGDVEGGPAEVMAELEALAVTIDTPARLVVNERTGTIVAGGNIRINEVMVTYGSIVVTTREDPVIVQPNPFGEGETAEATVGEAGFEEERTQSVVLDPNTNVNELAAALNELGLTARDIIAIFQAIDRAGALQGTLEIL